MNHQQPSVPSGVPPITPLSTNKRKRVLIFALIIILATAIGAGAYFAFFKKSLPNEETLKVIQKIIKEDLKDQTPLECLKFESEKTFDYITYTTIKLSNEKCPIDLTSVPTIPKIKINLKTNEILLQSLDGEFRPLVSKEDTSAWKTYRNEKYGFEFKYPPDWIVQDSSYTYQGQKSPSVNIVSPISHNIAGYETIGAEYNIQLQFYNSKANVTLNSFVKVREAGEQEPQIIPATTAIKNTDEYRTAQQIIASAKIINSTIESTSDWKTYYNERFNFSFRYPANWQLEESETPSGNFSLTVTNPTQKVKEDSDQPRDLILITTQPTPNTPSCKGKTIRIGDKRATDTDWQVGFGLANYRSICLPNLFISTVALNSESKELMDNILMTFNLEPPLSLPTTCIDQQRGGEGTPVITAISPTSGPVGTNVEIRGCNLAGFESDLDAVFVRSDGAEIPLYGGTVYHSQYSQYNKAEQGKLMIVTVQSYCLSGSETGRYSGTTFACKTVEATPGVYKVYVTAWNKKSNAATFTILDASLQNPREKIINSFHESYFEGYDRLEYSFNYSTDDIASARVVEVNKIEILEEAGKIHTVTISYEGGRGFTPNDYWEQILKPACKDCQQIPNSINIKDSQGMLTFANDSKEWIIFGGPAGTARLFVAELQKPAAKVEKVLSTLTFNYVRTKP